MKTTEIRQKFLDYFEGKGHRIVPSSSLVPGNDPTLLFTNAGMVQFKDLFLGEEKRDYVRAVTAQRCVRAGGKHNDLENVGYTARHHTFFEMLGNFSFGDYFKEDAIHFAWELLTGEFGLPAERLWVTVFEEDDEAESIWVDQIGVPTERVARIGAKDNFWQMGDTGPCGPCSEIFYDHGPEVEGGPPGTPEEDGDRYVEIWNLVFMQFNRNADGSLDPLPKPSVDTGMGLERMAAVLQHVHSNYEIDLFSNLIDAAADILGIEDRESKSLRVIADHIRSTAFMITDGVIPSNEGRGYVLRRIIRRAIRHGYQSGCQVPFMHRLVEPLVREMGDAYPELAESAPRVAQVLEQENEKFNETLEQGLRILDQEIGGLEGNEIPGEAVFKLYDTYGFPADLTADVARERDLSIDSDGFERCMEDQRQRARSASQFAQADQVKLEGVEKTAFLGYEGLDGTGTVVALVRGEDVVEALGDGEEGMVVLDQTPFYAESGGQVGDTGVIEFPGGTFEVSDTRYLAGKVVAHIGRLSGASIATGDEGNASVRPGERQGNACHHSATHLLHAALKQVLGKHVEQKGSLVASGRLRFDFSHFEPVSAEQLREIEHLVNENIRANHPVSTELMELDQAKAAGAEALFGEKYDANVRTVRMGHFSFELCGGTHVNRTGDIGMLKVLSETGIAAGVRRIEAICGPALEAYLDDRERLVAGLANVLKTTPDKLAERVEGLLESQKQQARLVEQLQTRLATGGGSEDAVREVNGTKVVVVRQDEADAKTMRNTVDHWRNRIQSGVVVVVGESGEKATLIAGISKDLNDRLQAGALIGHLAPIVGGKGGGRPDLAQGGGPDTARLGDAMEAVYDWVAENHA